MLTLKKETNIKYLIFYRNRRHNFPFFAMITIFYYYPLIANRQFMIPLLAVIFAGNHSLLAKWVSSGNQVQRNVIRQKNNVKNKKLLWNKNSATDATKLNYM